MAIAHACCDRGQKDGLTSILVLVIGLTSDPHAYEELGVYIERHILELHHHRIVSNDLL
jgi:hypothetical protein